MTATWVVVVAGRLQKQAHGTEAYMYRRGVFHLTPWFPQSWDCAYARFHAPKPEKMELLASGTGLSLRVLVELLLWSSRERHGVQAQANQSRSGFRTPIRLRLSRKGRSTLLRSSFFLGPRTRTEYDASPTRTCTASSTHEINSALLSKTLCEIRTILRWCLARLSNTIRTVSRIFARPPRPWRIRNNRGMAWISEGLDTFWKRAAWLVRKQHMEANGVSSAVVVPLQRGKDRPKFGKLDL